MVQQITLKEWQDSVGSSMQRGFAVFPLWPNTKVPTCKDGCKRATNDISELEDIILETGGWPVNIGVEASRSNLILVDVDAKPQDNRVGIDVWNDLIFRHGNTPTLSATTPSGGKHYYFKRPADWTATDNYKDNVFGPGIEIKVHNQYLVMAPSTIDGAAYRWDDENRVVADLPKWIREAIEAVEAAKVKAVAPVIPTVTPGTIRKAAETFKSRGGEVDPMERAAAYLRVAGPAVEGHGGDLKTFQLAGQLKAKIGLSESEVFTVMDGEWNASCRPPWGADELRKKIASGFHNGTSRSGPAPWEPKYGRDDKGLGEWVRPVLAALEPQPAAPAGELAAVTIPPAPEIVEPAGEFTPEITKRRDDVPAAIADIADYLAYTTGRQDTDIRHLMVAAHVVGMTIGKRFTFQNHYYNAEYYLNLWVAWLAQSGENKSGVLDTAQDLLNTVRQSDKEDSCTFAALLEFYGTKYKSKEEYTRNMGADLATARAEKNSANIFVDEFTSLLNTLVPPQQPEFANKLCKLYEKQLQYFPKTTTQGYKGIYDPCINFMVTSQEGGWNGIMRGSHMEVSGLTNRWLPLSKKTLHLAGWEQRKISKAECVIHLDAIAAWSDYYSGSTVSTTCDKDNRTDYIESQVATVLEIERFSALAKTEGERLSGMSKKALVQAAKIAGIWSVCDAVQKDTGEFTGDRSIDLNCDKYFTDLYMMVLVLQMGSIELETTLTQNSEVLNRVLGIFRRKGKASKRDIYKSLHLDKGKVDGIIQMLLEGGQIEKYTIPGSREKDVFKLSP